MADLEAVLADVSYLMAMEKSKCTPAARASKKIILPDPRYTSSPYSLLRDFRRRCVRFDTRRRRMARRRRTSPHFLPLPSLSLPLLFFPFSSSYTVFLVSRAPFEIPLESPMHPSSDDVSRSSASSSLSNPLSRVWGIKKCLQTAAISKVDARTFREPIRFR